MSNINDYILWRGDLSFKTSPFNIIDDMILARFSYLPFSKIKMDPIESIESIAYKFSIFKDEEFGFHGDKDLITNMGKSIRFKDLKASDFIFNTEKETEKQFAAITIHLDDNNMYISFNGTDASVVGWKESFNLSFMENIPSQIEASKYLEAQSQKYIKSIRIGGHSKGGNIAIYSGIKACDEIQDRIVTITNYDGPGFSKEFVESENYKKMLNKIYTLIPQSSIIGRLLEHKENLRVIKSIEKGIYQHDIFSWQVLGTTPILLPKTEKDSDFFNQTIHNWLKETTPQQRKIFIDAIFELFDTTHINSLKNFSEFDLKKINELLKTYNNVNEEEKELIKQMIFEFIDCAKKSFFEFGSKDLN